jgi:hypothetical protein
VRIEILFQLSLGAWKDDQVGPALFSLDADFQKDIDVERASMGSLPQGVSKYIAKKLVLGKSNTVLPPKSSFRSLERSLCVM